jgi:hypothetical protein
MRAASVDRVGAKATSAVLALNAEPRVGSRGDQPGVAAWNAAASSSSAASSRSGLKRRVQEARAGIIG